MAIAPTSSNEIQLFEPPADVVYTIEGVAHLVDLSPRTILVYCRHRLLSPVINVSDRSYSFDRESIRALRRIEALRTICGNDFAGIKIILDLTDALERLQLEVRSLSREREADSAKTTARAIWATSSRRTNGKSNPRRKKNEWNV
jgi:DNA-binding transcriptional MerR regulator